MLSMLGVNVSEMHYIASSNDQRSLCPLNSDLSCQIQLEQSRLWLVICWQADAELAAHITAADVLPYFALSWYITWFAHDVKSLPAAARLFDLFLSSHPLMPLYVGVVAMKARRTSSPSSDSGTEGHL